MISLRDQRATNHPNSDQYDMTGYDNEKTINTTMKKISKRSLSTTSQGDGDEPYIRKKQSDRTEGRGRSEIPHQYGSHRNTLSSISSHESTMTPHSDQRSSRGRARTGTSGRRQERTTNRIEELKDPTDLMLNNPLNEGFCPFPLATLGRRTRTIYSNEDLQPLYAEEAQTRLRHRLIYERYLDEHRIPYTRFLEDHGNEPTTLYLYEEEQYRNLDVALGRIFARGDTWMDTPPGDPSIAQRGCQTLGHLHTISPHTG